MKPTVSVLLPVWNGEKYVRLAIESVLAQTFEDWELCIGDNASTDGTSAIVEAYHDPRIRVYRHATNIGAAGNWDFLLQNARGDYACILGADDLFEPNHLERKVTLLSLIPGAPFIYGAAQIIDAVGGQRYLDRHQGTPFTESPAPFLAKMLKTNVVNITPALIRLPEIKVKKIGFDLRYPVLMDWRFWIEVALNAKGPIMYDQAATIKYRVHAQSATSLHEKSYSWVKEMTELRIDSLDCHAARWREMGFNPVAEKERITRALCASALEQARRGHWQQAEHFWRIYRQFHRNGEAVRDALAHCWKRIRAKWFAPDSVGY
jgi:glycosyltransferase involved in cell wall biosynthesis